MVNKELKFKYRKEKYDASDDDKCGYDVYLGNEIIAKIDYKQFSEVWNVSNIKLGKKRKRIKNTSFKTLKECKNFFYELQENGKAKSSGKWK